MTLSFNQKCYGIRKTSKTASTPTSAGCCCCRVCCLFALVDVDCPRRHRSDPRNLPQASAQRSGIRRNAEVAIEPRSKQADAVQQAQAILDSRLVKGSKITFDTNIDTAPRGPTRSQSKVSAPISFEQPIHRSRCPRSRCHSAYRDGQRIAPALSHQAMLRPANRLGIAQ